MHSRSRSQWLRNGLKIRCECHPWRLTVTRIKNASPNASGLGTVLNFLELLRKLIVKSSEQKWSGRWDSNPQPPTSESKLSTLYFHHLQNRPIKICVHAAHTVHALPDLRIAGGRFGGRVFCRSIGGTNS